MIKREKISLSSNIIKCETVYTICNFIPQVVKLVLVGLFADKVKGEKMSLNDRK